MSQRLKAAVDRYLVKAGAAGKAKLCVALGRTERTLLRWIQRGAPTKHDAYTLAVACGCTEEDALEIAEECFPIAKAG